MKKYRVTEVITRDIEIEAKNAKEAAEIAEDITRDEWNYGFKNWCRGYGPGNTFKVERIKIK